MTLYPFPFPPHLIPELPEPAKDGNYYVDIRVRDRWDGILVVNAQGMVIGVQVCRGIAEYPLPFAPVDIQGVRPASVCNRFLASIPLNLFSASLISLFLISPVLLVLGFAVHALFFIGVILLCTGAILLMYQSAGFPWIRLPAALLGIYQVLFAIIGLLKWLRHTL
ncbi:MAG: hypothetical protein GXX96_24235 [Planctomycetaceae bacterium]|nr:hypothetical protein [Planctomycetaceae bacterium]